MNIQDGYNSSKKAVMFDTQDRLDDELDKTIEEGHSMIRITEVTLGEEMLEECKLYRAEL